MVPTTLKSNIRAVVAVFALLLPSFLCFPLVSYSAEHPNTKIDYPELSIQLVSAASLHHIPSFDSLSQLLADVPFEVLKNQLYSDNRKKAFWLNIHNAFSMYLLHREPSSLKNHAQFLATKQIPVAGSLFSLNDIEHGILRRSSYKTSQTETITLLRVLEFDYRVHFGINFGAKDCPAIVPYGEHTVKDQLKNQEKLFITAHTTVDAANKELHVSALFNWYKDDFGGKEGIRSLLINNGFSEAKDWKLTFTPFNWLPG